MEVLPDTAVVGVVGAGTMGAGIAQVAASAGYSVLLYDAMDGAATRGLEKIAALLERKVEKGTLHSGLRDEILGRIKVVNALKALGAAGLVIEAIVEKLSAKQQLFHELEQFCGKETILASNTSSISITEIGAGIKFPERLVGMHFFNPPQVMNLVEIVSGLATQRDVADMVFETAKEWGKHPVHASSTPGFIVNRVARPFYAEGLRLLQERAASVSDLDAVMRDMGGFRMGPFELMDLIGNDVNYAVTSSVFEAFQYDSRFRPSLIQQELVAAGRLGRKSGRGFYEYFEGAPNDDVSDAIPAQKPTAPIWVEGNLGIAEGLYPLLAEHFGPVTRTEGEGLIKVGGVTIALTDGRSATQRMADDQHSGLVLFDLAQNYATASRIALAAAEQASPEALEVGVGLFQALGKKVTIVNDVPGLVVMRTIAMLASEGSDAVLQGVCDIPSVDVAMCSGLNYPEGPMEWADRIGLSYVLRVMNHLQQSYGEERYRASLLMRTKIAAGHSFYKDKSSVNE